MSEDQKLRTRDAGGVRIPLQMHLLFYAAVAALLLGLWFFNESFNAVVDSGWILFILLFWGASLTCYKGGASLGGQTKKLEVGK